MNLQFYIKRDKDVDDVFSVTKYKPANPDAVYIWQLIGYDEDTYAALSDFALDRLSRLGYSVWVRAEGTSLNSAVALEDIY